MSSVRPRLIAFGLRLSGHWRPAARATAPPRARRRRGCPRGARRRRSPRLQPALGRGAGEIPPMSSSPTIPNFMGGRIGWSSGSRASPGLVVSRRVRGGRRRLRAPPRRTRRFRRALLRPSPGRRSSQARRRYSSIRQVGRSTVPRGAHRSGGGMSLGGVRNPESGTVGTVFQARLSPIRPGGDPASQP